MRELWRFGKATFQKIQTDQITYLAAAISYYAIFSLFPLLLGLIALASLFLDAPSVRATVEERVISALPASADLVTRNIDQVVEARGTLGLISILGFFWSATGVFSAIRTALNRAWGVQHTRPFIQAKLLELAMVLSLGALLVVSVGLTWILQTIATLEVPILGLRPFSNNPLWNLTLTLVPLAFTILVFIPLYRYVPDTHVTWRQSLLGAAVAGPLFELSKLLFVWYAENKANYALVYGSVGTVIALLTWAYISAVILLLGAEVGAVYAGRPSSQTAAALQETAMEPHHVAQLPTAQRRRGHRLLVAVATMALASLLLRCLFPTRGEHPPRT